MPNEVQNCYGVAGPTFETPLNKDSVLLDGALTAAPHVPGDPFINQREMMPVNDLTLAKLWAARSAPG